MAEKRFPILRDILVVLFRETGAMIIEANGRYYTTTLHTDERMVVRGISAEQIKQAIENGSLDLTESGDDIYRLEITGRTIAVIITDDERIISVYPIG